MLPFSFCGNCVGVVGTQHGGTVDIRRNLLRTLDSIHGGEGRPRVLSKTARSLWMMASRDNYRLTSQGQVPFLATPGQAALTDTGHRITSNSQSTSSTDKSLPVMPGELPDISTPNPEQVPVPKHLSTNRLKRRAHYHRSLLTAIELTTFTQTTQRRSIQARCAKAVGHHAFSVRPWLGDTQPA